jgi:hypothetical protein
MKRSMVSLGVLAQLLAVSAGVAAVSARPARHIRLSVDDEQKGPPGLVRFLSQRVELAEGVRQSWVTLTRTGQFSDPRYGDFEITPTHLAQMVDNFNRRTLGQDVFLDVAHRPSDGAAAKVLRLSVENGRLRALAEWTDFGIEAVKRRGFIYLSAEYHENYTDNEAKKTHGCVLLGAGLTTRPVIKNLDPIDVKQLAMQDAPDGVRLAISTQLIQQLSEDTNMNYLEQLKAKLLAMGIAADVATKLLAEAKKQFDAAGTDGVRCLAVLSAWEATGQTLVDQLKALGVGGAGAGGAGAGAGAGGAGAAPVSITLSAPSVDVGAEVARLLAQRDADAAQAQTAMATKLKLLSDTIAAGDPTLTPEGVKKLSGDVAVHLSAVSTDAQVLALANMQVDYAKKLSAAHKLATLGYMPVGGSVQISVDSSNSIKALQESVDRRLGFGAMSLSERFERTGGVLLAKNKTFAEKALEQFDALNGHRLDAEHRALAAGTGMTSDTAVPAIAERTVLREALYNLVSLNFMNVGTAPFAQVITIPYSYRDTSAAGANALRIYEGQGIRNAGVIQDQEEARPIPQKLAFKVTEEMRMLLSASVIDFDPVAENIRNIIRIVGEDTEALNCNELVFSADEAGATTFTNTLTAQCNGTNAVFVTTVFPLVRPRKAFDLKGVQQGATVNPLTVTLGGTARAEYALPADGSALANGTYYIADWNLGEIRFVDQTGARVVPANETALVVAGSYSTNAVKFDTDAVSGEDVKDRYDRLLTVIGARKAVINSDRYYNANMVMMSATVDNAISQARGFEANASRVATGLASDGSVGQIKAMPTFNTTAPGLVMGDTRILMGESRNSRFRMVKPFAMNPLEQARNSSGQFIDAKESFGTQWVVSHTPKQLKNALTSVVLFSATGRVARA